MSRHPTRKSIRRRECLRLIAGAAIVMPALVRAAAARADSTLPPAPTFDPADATLLPRGGARLGDFLKAYNRRTMVEPQVLALCRTPTAVATMLDWLRTNSVPFALRSGGHSFEGFSQSNAVVVDTRFLNRVELDAQSGIVTAGAGANIGSVYRAIAARGFAFAGGSCPTVGIAGHALGGGYGLMARQFGLACDNLLALDLVDPAGRMISADATSNPDLFWANRGGGGGTFGAATSLRLRVQRLSDVRIFTVSWQLPAARAANVFRAWQDWAPHAPDAVTAIMKISSPSRGTISLRCVGQSTGSADELARELRALTATESATPQIESLSFLQAVDHFSGGWGYESKFSKGKSDFVKTALSDTAVTTLFDALQQASPQRIIVICDAYGGAINRVPQGDTAFAHRADTLYCMQYYSSWQSPNESPERLKQLAEVYQTMRPFVSGEAYVNYCDVDLRDWPQAYWGANLPRLKHIKAAFDPTNFFHHAQSVPVPLR